MRLPRIRRRGRHEARGRQGAPRGDWAPNPDQWGRLAAGETVHGYRVERAPTRRRNPSANAREEIARRPFRQGESLATRVSRVPRGLWWKDPPGRGRAERPPAPVPHRGERQPNTGMWRR